MPAFVAAAIAAAGCRAAPTTTKAERIGEPRRPTKPVPAGRRGSGGGGAGAAATGQLVGAQIHHGLRGDGAVGALAGQLGQRADQFAQRAADRDAEHALAAPQQVDDLFGGGALVDRRAVGEQGDPGQVVDAAGAQVSTAARMFCSETPVSSSRLTTLSTRMSLNEYSRWLPEPAAERTVGTTRSVRAQ